MNGEYNERDWAKLKSTARREWEALTEDDLAHVEGNRERLIGLIQSRYGISREDAKRQVEEWANRL